VDPAIAYWKSVLEGIVAPVDSAAAAGPGKKGYAIAIDFSVDEGLYLDSKTTSFEASWLLLTSLQTILTASGIWRWATPSSGGNRWAMSVRSVSGWKSWLANVLNPNQDIIVDLGGGSPPAVPFGG